MGRRRKKRVNIFENIPAKANRVLNLILIGMTIITLRVWHLSVIQHEDRLEESRRPQKRVVVEPAKRGTIRDRFNIPLAINKVQYNAAIIYSQICQIPSIKWENVDGKKVKRYKRREYISELAQLLGVELNLDVDRLEDLIHSKAALYNNLPYIVKEDISEREYYRLKILEKDWLGIHMQSLPKRHYPMGKVGGDIIGYMGAISREEYEGVVHEIKSLENCLLTTDDAEDPVFPPGINDKEQAERRLQSLIEHAYSVNDYVGKTGIEGRFEEELRGYHGKKSYFSDARGNFLRELPDSKSPLSGSRFLLSISAELQHFSEELLIQNEEIRSPRVTGVNNSDSVKLSKKHPWIKGGAVVAMDPFTGDILAMASYPRFDPNDFIASGNPEISKKKNSRICRWFETDGFLGEIWDQNKPLEREIYDLKKEEIAEESVWLTWEKYLELVLAEDSDVKRGLRRIKSVRDAIKIQESVERLMSLTDQNSLYPLFNIIYQGQQHSPYGTRLPAVQQEDLEEVLLKNAEVVLIMKNELDPFLANIPSNYDKVLLIDLCRLVVDPDRASNKILFPLMEQMNLSSYRQNCAAWVALETAAKKMTKEMYREIHFKPWREEHQKAFLQQKRMEEKASRGRYAKPYLDLLDKKESEMFASFWECHRWNVMLAFLKGIKPTCDIELQPYYDHYITWEQELLQGANSAVEWNSAYHILRRTFEQLSDEQSIALMKSFRGFKDLNRPLLGRYRHVKRVENKQLEKHLATAFYPAHGYGYGRSYVYRQAATLGSIFKIVTAYEALVQKYNKLNSRTKNLSTLNPFVMVDDTHKKGKATFVGYDISGRSIPQLYKGGRIPRSHRSGIGKVDLLTAFEVSSNPYFSLLTVDYLENPNDLSNAARQFCLGSRTGIDLPAEIAGSVPVDLDCNRNGLYSMAIGQHSLVVTPLQTAVMLSSIANGGKNLKPKIVNMVIGKDGAKFESGIFANAQSRVYLYPTEISGEVYLPKEVRDILLEGMSRVSKRTQTAAWGSLAKLYADYPDAISDLIDIKGDLLGKSSTAESVENIDLDLKMGTNIYNHTWFGGIVCDSNDSTPNSYMFRDQYGNPELVVVVYLRYGAWGKDAVPVAAQVAQKWREIKQKHKESLL